MLGKQVPFFAFSNAPNDLKSKWKNAALKVIDEGIFVNGPRVKEFEESWAQMLGVEHAIGVGNGFDGLALALEALGIGPGDTVAVPAHTFIASWTSIKRVGAIPIGVDVNSEGLMDYQSLESLPVIPTAVMPVHMHGKTCEMKEILMWARVNAVFVIEDASQAHLASNDGLLAGTMGDVGVFSLYPTKNLGALGDAGVVVTNSPEIAHKVKQLANYGSSAEDKYLHTVLGSNSRLDEMQAAFLLVSVSEIANWNKRRRMIAKYYDQSLRDWKLQNDSDGHIYHHYVLKTNKRDGLRRFLASRNIGSEIHYPNLASDEYFALTGQQVPKFATAVEISKTILSIPLHQWLDDDEVEIVKSTLTEARDQGMFQQEQPLI